MLEKILKFISEFFVGAPGGGTVVLARTLHAPDGRHRVCFFHRKEDGVYGFREELYDNRGVEECWIPMKHGHVAEYPTMDAALAAAKAEVPWLHGAL